MAPTTSLIPPRRLGSLLREARASQGRSLTDLTTASGLSLVELDDIEHGRRDLDETTLGALITAYGVEGADLVPARAQLVIDLDDGRIAVNRTDVDVDPASGPDAVLTRYLALVYRLRDLPPGTRIPLREIDVDVLATALSLPAEDITTRLERLVDSESAVERDQQRIRRQLLLPLVGVVIAATTVGTLVLVADAGETPPPAPAAETGSARIATPAIEEAGAVETDIGNGGAIEVNPNP